jgi:hypothetical protein
MGNTRLNSGTIKDAAGNAATLTLASLGASGSLGANKALVVAKKTDVTKAIRILAAIQGLDFKEE